MDVNYKLVPGIFSLVCFSGINNAVRNKNTTVDLTYKTSICDGTVTTEVQSKVMEKLIGINDGLSNMDSICDKTSTVPVVCSNIDVQASCNGGKDTVVKILIKNVR